MDFSLNFLVDGSYALTCGSDRKIKLWNPKSGLLLKTYAGHGDEVTDIVGSCDSAFICSASMDKSIIYWDVSTGLPVRRLRSHAGGVSCVKFNEDSSVAISGSRDNSVMIWDIRTHRYEPIQSLKEAKDCITEICVTEHKIITSSLDGCIRQYDIRVGEMTCDKIGEPISYMCLSNDEQCVIAACSDNVIRLIDLDAGDVLSEYRGHITTDYKVECGLLKGDSFVISGSSDGSAIIWDFLEGNEVKRLHICKNNSVINSINVHPKSSDVIFAKKREIQVWGAPTVEIMEIE